MNVEMIMSEPEKSSNSTISDISLGRIKAGFGIISKQWHLTREYTPYLLNRFHRKILFHLPNGDVIFSSLKFHVEITKLTLHNQSENDFC